MLKKDSIYLGVILVLIGLVLFSFNRDAKPDTIITTKVDTIFSTGTSLGHTEDVILNIYIGSTGAIQTIYGTGSSCCIIYRNRIVIHLYIGSTR